MDFRRSSYWKYGDSFFHVAARVFVNCPCIKISTSCASQVQQVDLHLDERNQEIDRIASSIQDLATVMKDMSQLVIEQGTVLDRIDYNIEESQFKTQEATEQLRQAERYQRRG